MNIYFILRTKPYHDFYEIDVCSTEQEMFDLVCVEIINRMKFLGADDILLSVKWYAMYIEIIDKINTKDYLEALKTYNIFNKLLSTEFSYLILPFIKEEFSDTNSTIDIKSKFPDVPCKVCKRNVSANESHCWNCGVKEPAV
jgi:hypothetical protein